MIRIGHGFDVHAFGEARPLIIGGVEVPYHTGFIAHSDGDVALHALTDALLGAMALGDIGKLFPDTDMQYKMLTVALDCVRHIVGCKRKAMVLVMWI